MNMNNEIQFWNEALIKYLVKLEFCAINIIITLFVLISNGLGLTCLRFKSPVWLT